jgi:hypothetical protein
MTCRPEQEPHRSLKAHHAGLFVNMRTITEHHWCAFYQRSSSCRRRQRYYNATSLVGLPMIAVLIRELIHIGNDYEIVSM